MPVQLTKRRKPEPEQASPWPHRNHRRAGLGRSRHRRRRLRPRCLRLPAQCGRQDPLRCRHDLLRSKASADGSVTRARATIKPVMDGAMTKRSSSISPASRPDIERIAVSVTIYDAETRRQNFGMVSNAFIRVVNKADGTENRALRSVERCFRRDRHGLRRNLSTTRALQANGSSRRSVRVMRAALARWLSSSESTSAKTGGDKTWKCRTTGAGLRSPLWCAMSGSH